MIRRGSALALTLALFLGAAPLFVASAPRTADQILSDFRAVKYPGFVRNIELEEYRKLVEPPARKQCQLALELTRDHPNHAQVPRLMGARWALLLNTFGRSSTVLRETADVIAEGRHPELIRRARLLRAKAGLMDAGTSRDDRFRFVREALKADPSDADWGVSLLVRLATEHVVTPAKQRELLELAVDRYGDAAADAKAFLRRHKLIGKPLALEFDDLLTGRRTKFPSGRFGIVFVWGPTVPAAADSAALKSVKNADVVVAFQGAPKPKRAKRAARKEGLTFPLFFEKVELEKQWAWRRGIRYSRTFLLVGRDGNVLAITRSATPIVRWLNGR